MTPAGLQSDSKRRIVDYLKRSERATAGELAQVLEVTSTAVRQHLDSLERSGLVVRAEVQTTGERGRPATGWKLTALATDLFPDRHSDLTVELISALRTAVGEDGLDKVIRERTRRQGEVYARVVGAGDATLAQRVESLATQRCAEGYLAEATANPDGSFDLVEHHCPICEAAQSCTYLCRDELALFQGVVGDDALVTRTTHLLTGDSRCSYRITPAARLAPG